MSKKQAQEKEISNNILFKIIIVGDAGVGKSCLLMKYAKDEGINDYNPTIGVEFQSKQIQIEDNQIKLQIWDTAGQESFRSIVRSFYRNASAVFIVYNITDNQSFQNLQGWYEEAKQNAQEDAIFVLVGAQNDREAERKIAYDDGVKFMKQNDFALFFETSAQTNFHINEAFNETTKLIYRNYITNKMNKSQINKNSSESSKIKIQVGEQLEETYSPQPVTKLTQSKLNEPIKEKKQCC